MLSNRKQETGETDGGSGKQAQRKHVSRSHCNSRAHWVILRLTSRPKKVTEHESEKMAKAGRRRELPQEVEHPGMHSQATTQPHIHKAGLERMRDHTVSTNLETVLLSTECWEEMSTAGYRNSPIICRGKKPAGPAVLLVISLEHLWMK